MAAGNPIDQLATQLAALQRQVNILGKGTALALSSIDNGALTATQTVTDANGNPIQQVTTIVGQQYDGTSGAVVVAGPTPPRPAAPTLSQAIGGVKVQWRGDFLDPQPGFASPVVAPMDFAGVDVQVSADLNFGDTGFGPTHGTIVSAAGGELFVSWPDPGTPLYARLVTRTKAGKYSAPSLETGPIDSGQVQLGDIGFPIAQYSGGNTVYYTVGPATPTAPSWGFAAGDLWLEQVGTATGQDGGAPSGTPLYQTSRWDGAEWVLLQDQGISNALASAITAQATASAKAQVFTQGTQPSYSGDANTAYWIDTAHDNVTKVWTGSAWAAYTLGNGAITPNALIASDVIATGTVTSALLETTMVLANTLVAGDLGDQHATMDSQGFHVYQPDPNGGPVAQEVARLGLGSSNFLGLVDPSSNQLLASIDSTGQINAQSANIVNDPTIMGQKFSSWVGNNAGGLVSSVAYTLSSSIGPISSEYGLIQHVFPVQSGRTYLITINGPTFTSSVGSGQVAQVMLRARTSGSAQRNTTISDPEMWDVFINGNGNGADERLQMTFPWNATYTGQCYMLLTLDSSQGVPAPGPTSSTVAGSIVNIAVSDLGPTKSGTTTLNSGGGTLSGGGGGGTPPAATQQYSVSLQSNVHATYNGSGVARNDTTDVIQGYDPSGYNGDGYGFWTFPLPTITGTITGMSLYIYNNWAYYNSGGTAIINVIKSGNAAGGAGAINALKLGSDQYVAGFPKPGAVTWQVPSNWWNFFKSGGGAVGFSLGPSGGTNETYYLRADGPSARLNITYSQ